MSSRARAEAQAVKRGKPWATSQRIELKAYLKDHEALQASGGLLDDPNPCYLLGFEEEKIIAERPKDYARRLWLPFQSTQQSALPGTWLDHTVETFAKELQEWITDYTSDPEKWFKEYTKDAIAIEAGKVRKCGLFEGLVDHLLVARGWGDAIWGHRKYCRTPLCNGKPEEGYMTAPKWPQDRDRIALGVRQWIATSVQNPEKHTARRKPLTKRELEEQKARCDELFKSYTERERENSPEHITLGREETRQPFTFVIKEEESLSPPLEEPSHTKARAGPSAAVRSHRSERTSSFDGHVGSGAPVASSISTASDLTAAGTSSKVTRASSKRKASDRTVLQKRLKTACSDTASSQSNRSSRGSRERMKRSNKKLDRTLRGDSSGSSSLVQTAARSVREQQPRRRMRANSRTTPARVGTERLARVDQQKTAVPSYLPTPVISERSLTHYSATLEQDSSPDPTLQNHTTQAQEEASLIKGSSTASEVARLDQPLIGRSSLRSPTCTQVPAPTALLAGPLSSVSTANASVTKTRSSESPEDCHIDDAENSGACPDPDIRVPADSPDVREIQMELSLSDEGSVNQEQPLTADVQECGRAPVEFGASQSGPPEIRKDSQIAVIDRPANKDPNTPKPPQPTWESTVTATAHNLFINHNWGADWRSQLRIGGVQVQDAPTSPLAEALSNLSQFERSLPHLLSTYQEFQVYRAGKQADNADKHKQTAVGGLDKTVEQPTGYVSAEDLNAWLTYIKSARLPFERTDNESAKHRAEHGPKQTMPMPLPVDQQQPMGTVPKQGPLPKQANEPDNSHDSHEDLEMEPSHDLSSQSLSLTEECQASAATESFLTSLDNNELRDPKPLPQSSRIQNPRHILPAHSAGKANVQVGPWKPQGTTYEAFPVPSAGCAGAQPSGFTNDFVLPMSPVQLPLTETPIDEHYRRRSSSAGTVARLTDLPFPPGVSSMPRKCARCVHSLVKAFDVMKDAKGFAQWRKTCHYCRGMAARPFPCICDRCSRLGSEEVGNSSPSLSASSINRGETQPTTESSSGVNESARSPLLACAGCMQDDQSMPGLLNHLLKVHRGYSRVLCVSCNFERPFWDVHFSEHLSDIHNLWQIPCPATSCTTKQDTMRLLVKHFDACHNGPYICTCCGKTHMNSKALAAHNVEIREGRIRPTCAKQSHDMAAGNSHAMHTGRPYASPSSSSLTVNKDAANNQLTPADDLTNGETMPMDSHSLSEQEAHLGEHPFAEPWENEKWLDQLLDWPLGGNEAQHASTALSGAKDPPNDLRDLDEKVVIDLTGLDDIERDGGDTDMGQLSAGAFLSSPALCISHTPATQAQQSTGTSREYPSLAAADEFRPRDVTAVQTQREHDQYGTHSADTLFIPPPGMSLLLNEPHFSTNPRPPVSPITPPVNVAQPAIVGQHQLPCSLPHMPTGFYLEPLPVHNTPQNGSSLQYWGSVRPDALKRMTASMEAIFEKTVTMEYVLDNLVPKAGRLFASVAAYRGQHEHNSLVDHVLHQMRIPLQAWSHFRKRRCSLPIPVLSNSYKSGAANDLGVYTRIERLNRWFIDAARSLDDAERIRQLALCHDLARLAIEIMESQMGAYIDYSFFQGLEEVYEKQRSFLENALRGKSDTPSSAYVFGNKPSQAQPSPVQMQPLATQFWSLATPSRPLATQSQLLPCPKPSLPSFGVLFEEKIDSTPRGR